MALDNIASLTDEEIQAIEVFLRPLSPRERYRRVIAVLPNLAILTDDNWVLRLDRLGARDLRRLLGLARGEVNGTGGAIEKGAVDTEKDETLKKGILARYKGKKRAASEDGEYEEENKAKKQPNKRATTSSSTTPRFPSRHPAAAVATMQAFFDQNRYPNNDEVAQLMADTGLTRHQIRVWFENARRPPKK